jgi:hypothetical protein
MDFNTFKIFFAGAGEHLCEKVQNIHVYAAERGQNVSASSGGGDNGTGTGFHRVDLVQICK